MFNENKEEDSIELSHRLEDIRAEMEYPFAMIRTLLALSAQRDEPGIMAKWYIVVYRPDSFEEAFRSLHILAASSSFCSVSVSAPRGVLSVVSVGLKSHCVRLKRRR